MTAVLKKRLRHGRKGEYAMVKKMICCVVVAALAAAMLVMPGCSGVSESKGEINVFNWGEYISNGEDGSMDVIDEFEKETGIKVNYTTYETNEEMYNILKSSNSSYDIIIPSDYMIAQLIEEGLLSELDFDNIPNYKNIMEKYKKTDYDKDGKYSVPYSWGVVALCYNKTMVTEKPDSFSALWDEKYSGQILMFNNSRDAMAIAMKLKDIDPSNVTKEDIDIASDYLTEQKPILKKYVMDQVFTEMEGSQAALAQYYGGDIAVMMQNNEDLDYVLPKEGSNLFIDAMCIPKNSKNKELAEEFINFMLKAEVAESNAEYIGYSTPNSAAYELLDEDIKNNELIYPSDEYLSKCYTFTNLPTDIYNYMQDNFLKVQS